MMLTQSRIFHADLVRHWLLSALFAVILIVYLVVGLFWANDMAFNVSEQDRVLLKSVLYGVSIVLFPLVKLIRFIMLRLSQTMPIDKPNANVHSIAKHRYFMTQLTCLCLIELVGGFGLLMLMAGDGFNTFTIFTLLAVLGLFLHRPNNEEYQAIVDALNQNNV